MPDAASPVAKVERATKAAPASPQPYSLRIAAGCLAYAAPFCSTEETRYYLNGVFIEPTKTGPVAVATDGHTLIALHDPDGYAASECIIRLPKDFLARCRKHPDALVVAKAPIGGEAVAVWLVNIIEGVPGAAWDAPDGVAVLARSTATFIDGTFPQWRKVFPAALPAAAKTADGFQVRYLTRFQGPAEWADGGKAAPVCLLQEGDAPAVVAPGGGRGKPWIGVIMPMRLSGPAKLPKWVRAAGAPAQKDAA